ncbi:hypothetical protein FH972_021312 [Carpinus fangiana]|uniref:FAD-binding FR-type domain-containing protein n=1 Tax=Carpinus fangiana TaxID=176857 RepID=A0A5N6KP02_9ROSI|nr:hypothetical protein FH972_021312 [Carpinus fangiana]
MAAALHRRHDHGGMSASSMDDGMMSMGTIDVHHFPRLYWAFVGAVIAAFFVRNVIEYLICRQRLAAAQSNKPDPARPKNVFTSAYATLAAVAREASNASIPPIRLGRYTLRFPLMGSLSLVLTYVALILVLCFYRFDISDYDVYEQLAYRAGFVSLGQFPLLFLLAGKNNIIGYITGFSYERLNWLHRWAARGLLLSVTIHMGYWFSDWAPYGDYIEVELTTYRTATTGFSCWIILLWIVLSSLAPIRGWSYEIFVVQHVISFIVLITMVFIHTPVANWPWLWASVAIYFFDRVSRSIWAAYTNLAVFHRRTNSRSSRSGIWTCEAELKPLPFVLPLQSHPFTISSLPTDNKLEFIIKARAGGTKRLLKHAEKTFGLPSSSVPTTVPVVIQGPYGAMRPLRQFDSVILLAGSTGATFTTPLLRDIVAHVGNNSKGGLLRLAPGAVTRHVRYVWVVKSRKQLGWFTSELNQVVADVETLKRAGKRISLDLSVYITCDSTFTEGNKKSDARELPRSGESPSSISSSSSDFEEKMDSKPTTFGVEEVDPRSFGISSQENIKTCGSDGTCCCQTTIMDESGEEKIGEAAVCSCGSHQRGDASSRDSSVLLTLDDATSSEKKMQAFTNDGKDDSGNEKNTIILTTQPKRTNLNPAINLFSGRPHPRSIIQASLEQARGESAVVVCGPRGLNDQVRQDVVSLSDERAVHKDVMGAMNGPGHLEHQTPGLPSRRSRDSTTCSTRSQVVRKECILRDDAKVRHFQVFVYLSGKQHRVRCDNTISVSVAAWRPNGPTFGKAKAN